MLRTGKPGEQRQILGCEEVVGSLDLDGVALHDDTPGLFCRSVEAVDLERDTPSEDRRRELGALGRAEHDPAAVDDVVDGEDVGMVADRHAKPADGLTAQQIEALVGRQDRQPMVIGRHTIIIRPPTDAVEAKVPVRRAAEQR